MNYFIYIFTNIILPIFTIIILGFVLYRKFKIDIKTLTKIQFYGLIPAILFINIYNSELDGSLITMIMIFTISLFFIEFILSNVICKVFRYKKSIEKAFINSVVLFNSGNYGIPLISLLFDDPYAVSILVILMVVQNVLVNTVGVYNSSSGNGKSFKEVIMSIFKLPMMYVIIIAFFMRGQEIAVPGPLMSTITILSKGMVPVALLTLGAQLGKTHFDLRIKKVYLSNVLRLIVSPIIAYLITLALGLSGLVAQVLIIISAAPTAVNSVLLAIEYDNEPDFASQTVLWTTLFSAITVTTVIYLVTTFI
ncbi:AEC family transporter [Vallitalea okinawensis]|uniref:AEC family transporter n=1 Tax=Vallitalea okinawensis TaxID=2078660 RepID=UPI000CFCE353|nr:AEC family transporter [Vallitalea okinawensis]